MKYRGLSINYASMGVDMKIDMGLEVFVSRAQSVGVSHRSVADVGRQVYVLICAVQQ